MSEEITEREEFIKIVGILSFSDAHPSDCKYITNFIIDLAKENQQLKSVLDEIREYVKEHNDYLEKAKEIYICCNDELLKSTCIQLINNELVRNDNLLQILDKVKE